MAKGHKDVEFHVGDGRGFAVLKTFDEAAGHALSLAMSTGEYVNIDVVVYSKAGARWFGGSDAVEYYDIDPEASVFHRIVVSAHDQGMVP